MNTMTNTRGFRRLSATALCGVIASSFAAMPAVSDSFAPLTVRVKFGDLDLSRPRDAAVLYGRIRTAAEKVCSPYEASGLAAKMHVNACIREATSKAVTTVDAPALSLIHKVKMGSSVPNRLVSRRAAEDPS
jgi:UrcA family protein